MKLLIGLYMLALTAHAGHGDGNGGGAIVCADGNGVITSAQLLDLWEFEKKYPGSIIRSSEDKQLQLDRAVEKLAKYDKALARKVKDVLANLDAKKKALNEEEGILAPPSDTFITALRTPRNCPLSGAALYDDKSDTLLVDQQVLDNMGPTDLAALEFHEALYKVQRGGIAKPKNSVSARKITGAIFSNFEKLPEYKSPLHGTNLAAHKCVSRHEKTNNIVDQIYIIPFGPQKVRVQVIKILGERVFDKTYIDITPDKSHKGLLARLHQGLQLRNRLSTLEDRRGHSINPYAHTWSKQTYGPDIPVRLKVWDVVTKKKCYKKQSCYTWAWEDYYTFTNDTVYIQSSAVTYDYQKGQRPRNLECTPL